MPAKTFLDQIRVNPCTQSWDSMVGNDQFRFCKHCNLSVHNLAEMTRKEVERLIAKSQGRLCVRYQRRPDGSLRTLPAAQKLHRITRRASQVAAGAFSASIAFTGAALSQVTAEAYVRPAAIGNLDPQVLMGAAVVGMVRDQSGAAIPSASVSITSDQNKIALYTSVTMAGEFRFEGLTAGIYSLRVEAPGFSASELSNVYVQADTETRLDQILQAESLVGEDEVEGTQEFRSVGGAVIYVAPSDPFILAAQQDDIQEVTKLLAGRDVNARDKTSNTTALEHAVRNSNREMVQLLIGAGAKVNLGNPAGQTVLMMLDGDATSDLVWDLVNAGAKVNIKDNDGETPLMTAARYNNVDVIKTLLEAGAEVNARNKEKQTALFEAAAYGHVNVIRTLVHAGADVNLLDHEGKNALSFAVDGGHPASVRLLRNQGASEIAQKN
jgi:ankyrin repeat protein